MPLPPGRLPPAIFGPQPAPVNADNPPTREIGAEAQNSGGLGGWSTFLDEAERVPELTFPTSIETYHRMRTDSQIESLHLGTIQPIREYRWMIDPNKAPTAIVENAATDLGLPIKGQPDDEGIKRAANKFDFDRFLTDILLGPLYGFFHHEIVGEVVEAQDWRMRKLAPRHPRTIDQFQIDDTGELLAIKQRFAQGIGAMPPPIPASALVSYVWRPEAGSHVGRSMLRSMFPEWMVKDRTLRIAVINLQRAGGVPVIEAAQGASNKQLEELAQMARQFKVAEGGGGAIPFGSKLSLVGGSVPDAIALLNYCNEAMARVWALMLVQLGVTQGANRALGGEFAIYAARAQRLMAKSVVAAGNSFLDRYTEWNDPLADYAPLLAFEPSKPEGMSVTDLVALLDSGALTVDPEFEEWLRAEYALPDKQQLPDGSPWKPDPVVPPEPTFHQTPAPSRLLDPTSTSPTLAKAGTRDIPRIVGGLRASLTLPDRKLRRAPSANEIRAAVDYRSLDNAHVKAVAQLHEKYLGDVLPGQIRDLAGQVREGVAAHRLEAPADGHGLLKEHLGRVAEQAARGAVREAQVQGVSVAPGIADRIAAEASARAQDQAVHVAALNANGLSLAAQRRAGRLASRVRGREGVAADLELHLAGQKHVFERENLKGAVTFAQNAGRLAAFEAIAPDQPDAVYEASEILDNATCGPCEAIDGTIYDTLDEAQADYSTGGYVGCDGGPNCRGTAVAVYPEQNPEGGENRLREAEPPYDQPGGEGGEVIPGEPSIEGVETPIPAEQLVREAPTGLTEPGGQLHLPGVEGKPQLPSVDTTGIEPNSPAYNAAFEKTLESGPIDETVFGRKLGGSVNSVYKTRVEGGPPVTIFVKPEKGSRDFVEARQMGVDPEEVDLMRDNIIPGHDMQRERAAYLIAKRMGVPVPTTVIRDLPGEGPSLVSRGGEGTEAIKLIEPTLNPEDVHRVGLFDSVIGNTDRHEGNYLVASNGSITPIDHGLAFPDAKGFAWGNYKLINAAARGNSTLTDEDKQILRGLLRPEVAGELKGTGMSTEAIALFKQRIEQLLADGRIAHADDLFSSSGERTAPPGR